MPCPTTNAESLPKGLPGTVCRQWVRCGDRTCHCALGELHGPYYCRLWRENGKLRKKYVKLSEVETVRKQCATRQRLRLQLHQGLTDWRKLRDTVREVELDDCSSDSEHI
jgi:hypothetical protein